jgi:HPt (histidine-containing phosphotransfer) domain-containing protein
MSDSGEGVVYLNEEEGKKRMTNNTKLYIKLLTQFKANPYLNELVSTADVQDWERARAAAHAIKGMAANLSLTELYKQSMEVETQIKGNALKAESLESLKNCFAVTLTEIDKVIARNG